MRTADGAWRQERAAQNLADTRTPAPARPDRPPTRRPLTRAATEVGSSVGEDRQVELAQARGHGEVPTPRNNMNSTPHSDPLTSVSPQLALKYLIEVTPKQRFRRIVHSRQKLPLIEGRNS